MEDNNLSYNYVSLINRVIGDYNSIFSTLKTKDTTLNGQTIPTSEYADLIDRLTYIKGLSGNLSAPDSVDGVFSGVKAFTVDATNGIVRNGASFDLAGAFDKAYYIADGVKLTTTIPEEFLETVTLTGDISATWDLSEGLYTYSPSEIVSSISVKKGSVSAADNKIGTASSSLSFDSELESVLELDKNNTSVELLESGSNAYAVSFKSTANLKNISVSGSTKTTVTEGYVEDGEIVTDISDSFENQTDGDDLTVYIKQGGVTIRTASDSAAKASITPETGYSSILLSDNDTTTPSIELSASVKGNVGLSVTYEEGYVKPKSGEDNSIDTNVTVGGDSFRLRKATLSDAEFTPVIDVTSYSDNSIVASAADNDTIDITVSTTEITSANSTVNSEGGYVTAAALAGSSIKVNSAAEEIIKIKKAKNIKATTAITSYKMGGDSITTSDDEDVYSITVEPVISNPTISLATNGQYGYLGSATPITGSVTTADNLKAKTVNIAKGSVSLNTPTISLSVVDDEDDKLNSDGTPAIATIFKTTVPESGDYLKLNTTASATFKQGYIEDKDAPVAANSASYYIPKATFNWVTLDDGEEVLQVDNAGYVPSGFITEIANVGNLNEYTASVGLIYTNNDGISLVKASSTDSDNNYYKIDVTAEIDAGYISGGNADTSLTNREIYITKGKATPTASLEFGAPSNVSVATDGDGYNLTIEATANATFGADAKAGYIKNVSTLTDAATATDTATIHLDTAVFKETTHTTNIATTGSAGLVGSDANGAYKNSKYTVTPSITDCSVAFSVENAGWISNDYAENLTFAGSSVKHAGNHSVYYIKEADTTKISLTNGDAKNVTTADINANGLITSTVSGGMYPISLSGSVEANISMTGADGYYGQTELNAVFGSAKTVSVSNIDLSIKKGTVTVTANNAAASFTSQKVNDKDLVTLYTKSETEASNVGTATFAKLSSSGSISTTTTITEGYVKSGEAVEATGVTVSGDVYIKRFETTDKTYSGSNDYNFSVGQASAETALSSMNTQENASVRVESAGKYMSKDTVVTLSDHAMGKEVVKKLLALEERLAGIGAL